MVAYKKDILWPRPQWDNKSYAGDKSYVEDIKAYVGIIRIFIFHLLALLHLCKVKYLRNNNTWE